MAKIDPLNNITIRVSDTLYFDTIYSFVTKGLLESVMEVSHGAVRNLRPSVAPESRRIESPHE